MKANKIFTAVIILMIATIGLPGQVVQPVISFEDNAFTHNMHICSDSQYYYSVNGGVKEDGIINKFDLEGNWIGSYPLKLDTRSIMYDPADKNFYVNDYGRNIYKLTDFDIGAYEIIFKQLYENKQASLSLSPDGKQLYYLDEGTVKIYDFNDGKLLATLGGILHGEDPGEGSNAIAAGTKYFYTWDSKQKLVYVYNLAGELVKKIKVGYGNYGYSISYANSLVFISQDGDSDVGTWYGYDLDAVAEATMVVPKLSFVSTVKGSPYHICFNTQSKKYYTSQSTGSNEGIITEFSIKGEQKKSYETDKALRSIMFSPLDNQLYVNTVSKNFYKITKLKKVQIALVAGNIIENRDCTPSLTQNGINLYTVAGHKMVRRDFYMPKNKKVYDGIRTGENVEGGAYACAVGDKFIYTWDAQSRLVFIYNFEGEYLKTVLLGNGSIGTSLSYANKMLFAAGVNEEDNIVWYGYEIE